MYFSMNFYSCLAIVKLAIVLCIVSSGNGSPLFEGSSNWLDKIPSIEVKVRTDGISVKTGPSREEIYTLLGYVVLGLVVFVTLAILLTICIYKCCWKRSVPHITIHGAAPETVSHYPLHPTANNDGRIVNSRPFISTQYSVHANPTVVGTRYACRKEQNNLANKSVQSSPFRSTS